MTPALPQRLPYAAALDGLRALAVIAVLGYHLDFTWMRGGFLGVDLFFVISGFLITRLLVDEHRQTGRIALGGFWIRRFRRLVPPLVVVVGASILATRVWGVPAQWNAMRGDAVAALTYVANWRFIVTDTSYFDTLAGPSPLRHIWSLAVEEQWYVLWPLVMMAIAPWALRRQRAGRVSLAMLAAAALSALWMAVLFDPSDISRVYYGTDTRAQQLLVGAALAWLTVTRVQQPLLRQAGRLVRSRGAVTVVMVGFVAAVVMVGDEEAWLYHGGLFALSIGAAVLVAAASVPGTDGPLRWLAAPGFVSIGKRSYGLYLWHWPVIVFVGPAMGLEVTGLALAAIQVGVTVMLNEAMYRFIETPVRTGESTPGRLVAGWSAGGAVAALAAVMLLATDLPRLPDIEVLRPDLEALGPVPTVSDRNDIAEQTTSVPDSSGVPAQAAPLVDEAAAPPPQPLAVELPRLLLLGDSTALVLGTERSDELPTRWRATAYAQVGCAVTAGETIDVGEDRPTFGGADARCTEWEDDWSEVSAPFRPSVSVVMIGAWEVLDHIVDGQRLTFPSPEWNAHVEAGLRRAVGAATVGGGRAVLLRLPCMQQVANSPISADARNDPARVDAFNDILERIAASNPTTSSLPLDELLCPAGVPLDTIGGEDVRFDGVHLTPSGAQMVWEWLDDELIDFESPVS